LSDRSTLGYFAFFAHNASRWWMLMIRNVTHLCRSWHGIQCGIARISIVANTGVPSLGSNQQISAAANRAAKAPTPAT
jgi:hypothetical protein